MLYKIAHIAVIIFLGNGILKNRSDTLAYEKKMLSLLFIHAVHVHA